MLAGRYPMQVMRLALAAAVQPEPLDATNRLRDAIVPIVGVELAPGFEPRSCACLR